MTIYNDIRNFTAVPKYAGEGVDPDTGVLFDALGPNGNQLPLTSNVTFMFDYDQGAVEFLRINFRTKLRVVRAIEFGITDRWQSSVFRMASKNRRHTVRVQRNVLLVLYTYIMKPKSRTNKKHRTEQNAHKNNYFLH